MTANNNETMNDSSTDLLYNSRIVDNVACRCGNLYQYRDWEDDEKKCPECGKEQ